MTSDNIVLIGYRGTGKSTVGKLLAERIGYTYIDTDHEIEARAQMAIAEIFTRQGEPAFRDLESAVIADFASRSRQVLSLGGGAILRDANRLHISACRHVVWLRASVETIAARVLQDPQSSQRRPNLTNTGGFVEIKHLLLQRTPIYETLATLTIDTDEDGPERLVDQIISTCWEKH